MTAASRFRHVDDGTPESDWSAASQWADVTELRPFDGGVERLVVVAAHPDDETLGAGGLIALADARDIQVNVVLLTAGEASHPGSPTHTREELTSVRLEEFRQALAGLAPLASTTFLGLSDGEVEHGRDAAIEAVVDVIGRHGQVTLVAAPWRRDGHADHDAAGHIAAIAAQRTDARLVEYPIWLWHWGCPDQAPWGELRRVPLTAEARARKLRAMAEHRSQVAALSPAEGDEAILHQGMLRHFERDHETFVVAAEPPLDVAFEELHAENADPWSVRTRWYEQRKRALTLAALPDDRYARGLELGCSIGTLAAELAPRCDALVAVDRSAAAITRAREALGPHPGAEAYRMTVPEEWPPGQFDLVVLSESGYFLSPQQLAETISRIRGSLTDDGTVLLCHWRHPIAGWPLDGDSVHDLVAERSALHVTVEHLERDFLLHVLRRRPPQGQPELG